MHEQRDLVEKVTGKRHDFTSLENILPLKYVGSFGVAAGWDNDLSVYEITNMQKWLVAKLKYDICNLD